MPVTFFLPGEPDLERLRGLDPERDWSALVRGEHAWILQTYLRLRGAGRPVELLGVPPRAGLVVYHAKHGRALMRHALRLGAAVLVGVRADNREPTSADFQVLQNRVWDDGRSRFYVPHWPQSGLLPRDPARGTRIARVAYKGFARNLHPDFRGAAWREFLGRRGLEWAVDAVEFAEAETDVARLAWPDFRTADLLLAVRPPERGGHTGKPATKLVNAWLAGVPALLGPEPAYRELRRSDLDYLEVASVADAMAAVDRLLATPDLYRAMVEHGRERGREFTAEAIVPRWIDLLWNRIPALAPHRPLRRLPPLLRPPVRRLRRILEGRPAR
jgi:hypothetical protein